MDYLKTSIICLVLINTSTGKPIMITSNVYGLNMLKNDDRSVKANQQVKNVSQKVQTLEKQDLFMPYETPRPPQPNFRTIERFLRSHLKDKKFAFHSDISRLLPIFKKMGYKGDLFLS